MRAAEELEPFDSARDTWGRVVVGVALTHAVWLLLQRALFSLAPPLVLAGVVAVAAGRMGWGSRTAIASTSTLAGATLIIDVFYLRDPGHRWGVGVVVVYDILALLATWLAWKGGLSIAHHAQTD